jgi:hypothetical protein
MVTSTDVVELEETGEHLIPELAVEVALVVQPFMLKPVLI